MNNPTEGKQALREIVIYLLWLALAMALSTFLVLSAAALIFHTDRVPNEAAALAFLPPIYIVTWLRLRKTRRTFSDIGLGGKTDSVAQTLLGTFFGACFMVAVFAFLATTKTIIEIGRAHV